MPRVFSRVLAVACAGIAGVAALAPAQQPPSAKFRAGVDLISLTVTVTDRYRRFVSDLGPEDFVVLEDGRPQQVTYFTRANLPLSIALVVDSSGSMDSALGTVHEAATTFVRGLRAEDRGEIVDFDTKVRILAPFTSDQDALEKAIRATTADGSTAMYDAVLRALEDLNALPVASSTWPDRRAIVLLSDGDDTISTTPFEDVIELANRSDTAIYTVGLGDRDLDGRLAKYSAEIALRQLATQSGGRAFFPADLREVPGIYDEIRLELASQYALAYESSNARRDGRWRNISIRMAQRDLAARTKPGYYAPRAR